MAAITIASLEWRKRCSSANILILILLYSLKQCIENKLGDILNWGWNVFF